jgi:hypothetical protein
MPFANDGFYTDAERKVFDLIRRRNACAYACLNVCGTGNHMYVIWGKHVLALQKKLDDCLRIVENMMDDGEIRRIV